MISTFSNISFSASIYNSTNVAGEIAVILAPPDVPPVPSIYLFGPQLVGQCDDVILDATSTSGHGGRPFAKIEWSLVSNSSFQSISDINSILGASLGSFYVTFPAKSIPANSSFVVSVQVVNWLSQTSTAFISFRKKAADVPFFPIHLTSPNYQRINRYTSVSYDASTLYSISASSCINISDISLVKYTFKWKQFLDSGWDSSFSALLLNDPLASTFPSTEVLNLPSLTSSSRSLVIPSYTLSVGSTYGLIM